MVYGSVMSPRHVGSLYVAFYVSQTYGGGILTRVNYAIR
jgi:hypothetical protein